MRTTMAAIINRLRSMTNTSLIDYTQSTGQVFWDDQHLNDILDQYRVDVYREALQPDAVMTSGGTAEYRIYNAMESNWETSDGGTAVFYVQDNNWATVAGSLYAADYIRGRVTFTTNTLGSAYFLTGSTYDLPAAAADVWRQKAAHFSEHVSFSADGMSINRQQLISNCLMMADKYAAQTGAMVATIYRSDVNA